MASVKLEKLSAVSGRAGLEGLIKDVDQLVSLPEVYYRLESAIADPTSSTDRIAILLQSDADLCARLLRIANSAFYSFPTAIDSIDRAVATIGLRQIRELILITAVVKAFSGIPERIVNMTRFWEHSIAVGILARSLAQHLRLPQSDSIYIPGLLHDIGHLVMYLKLPELMHDLLLQATHQGNDLHQLEYDCLGYTHAEIGGKLLESWNLPASIYLPVLEHHDPLQGSEFERASCVVNIADAWVNGHRIDSRGEPSRVTPNEKIMSMLAVDMLELVDIGKLAGEQVRAVLLNFTAH